MHPRRLNFSKCLKVSLNTKGFYAAAVGRLDVSILQLAGRPCAPNSREERAVVQKIDPLRRLAKVPHVENALHPHNPPRGYHHANLFNYCGFCRHDVSRIHNRYCSVRCNSKFGAHSVHWLSHQRSRSQHRHDRETNCLRSQNHIMPASGTR